ncbi:CBS domain-containing protein [Noviherbaspirillum humi]|uniref:CBS domain-containing protein n=1 Tax=Noviherbaspirillum humi TaxID=1688639 RepID=A0A239FEI5_9BURK|nr:CBS domain-containing protein [Noviherbaspirillum humi]SNS55165.1 CBS domain-containing protein [Noviherbaspirillum humi]
MPIGELCKMDVVCCRAETTIPEVAELMRRHHVGDVVVVGREAETRMPIGIVTDRDIVVEVVAQRVDMEMLTAADIMSSPLQTVEDHTGFVDTLRRMSALKVRRLPVVRPDGTLCGIVSIDDIINTLASELSTITTVLAEQPKVESRIRR